MELFNEIYSCYYHTVRHILAEAAGHSVNMKEMEQICKNQAFQETALAVLPKLTKGEWPFFSPQRSILAAMKVPCIFLLPNCR